MVDEILILTKVMALHEATQMQPVYDYTAMRQSDIAVWRGDRS